MTVKELIEKLREQPQNAEVFYICEDSGLISVSNVKEAIPATDETADVTGGKFVLLE